MSGFALAEQLNKHPSGSEAYQEMNRLLFTLNDECQRFGYEDVAAIMPGVLACWRRHQGLPDPGAGKYRRKGEVVDAVRLPPAGDDSLQEFHAWAVRTGFVYTSERDETLVFKRPDTPEEETAGPGDWIVKDAAGRFFVLSDAAFRSCYDPLGVANG